MHGDEFYMARALALAERGRGRTSPNPMVGAVVVDRDGVVVGRGWHEAAGGPHAEIQALNDAGDRARGATLYCTLEPCCHTGRTGPCAPVVVAAGIARVVVAMQDPNPLVSGGGLAHLRQHGLEVSVGVGADRAARLNRPFITRIRHGRPFVTVKAAISLDWRVAAAPGVRTLLTGPPANRIVHHHRAEVDAMAVGSGTILADDPLLTARGAYRIRPLVRVIFDTRLRTPPSARILSTLDAGPVIIMSTPSAIEAAGDRAHALAEAGARVQPVPAPGTLRAAIGLLAVEGVTSLVIEGGPSLHAAAWREDLVDCLHLYVAPRALGSAGVAWVSTPVLATDRVTDVTATLLGDDVRIEAYVHRPD